VEWCASPSDGGPSERIHGRSSHGIEQIGIDIGKTGFHVIGLGPDGVVVSRRRFSRSRPLRFFHQRRGEGLKSAFEACSGAHRPAHQLIGLGHEARLLTPESVRPFAEARKNGWNDALAIAEAAARPARHAVGIKSQERLDLQALHRVRQRLVAARTAVISQMRELLRERGIAFRSGRIHFERFVEEAPPTREGELDPLSRALFRTLLAECRTPNEIGAIGRELEAFAKSDPACRAPTSIPGIGFIAAPAPFGAAADVPDFRSGRDPAAVLGLAPRRRSTGGKTTPPGISKRGDASVRTLLIHGTRSAFRDRGKRDDRVARVMDRLVVRGLHANRIVAASADKAARTAWSVLERQESFRPVAARRDGPGPRGGTDGSAEPSGCAARWLRQIGPPPSGCGQPGGGGRSRGSGRPAGNASRRAPSRPGRAPTASRPDTLKQGLGSRRAALQSGGEPCTGTTR
jgi:transposase